MGLAGGQCHSLALRADGTVAAWGWGLTNTDSYPNYGQALVPAGLSNAVAVAAGDTHSLALRADGTVLAWGDNSYGQTNVPAGLSNVVALAASSAHSLALKSDGTLVGWGAGANNTGIFPNYGQAQAPAGLSNIAAIAAGGFHSLVLRADGTVLAWGDNTYGATSVPAGLSNVVAVAGGNTHSLALKSDGTVVAWGYNYYGETNVPLGLANGVAIAAGTDHNLLLENDGRPALTVQPFSQVASAGATVRFLALAAGLPPLSYQWQRNGTSLAGATLNSLTLNNVQWSDAGAYTLLVSNQHGSAASSVATLTVKAPPALTNQLANLIIASGGNASFAVFPIGTGPFTYQWQFNGTNLPGATAAILDLTNTPTAGAGVYTVRITGPYGTASASALLTVGTTLGVVQNARQMILNWTGPWALQSAANANGPYADIPGAASPFTNLMSAAPKQFFRLRCTVTNALTVMGASRGGFAVGAAGVPGYNYALEVSTNLVNWTAIQTNPVPFQFIDVNASNYPVRFYRTVLVP